MTNGRGSALYRCRLATPAEIEILRHFGCFYNGVRLADGCFVRCLARLNRSTSELNAVSLKAPLYNYLAGVV
jgi:hypothetical protein